MRTTMKRLTALTAAAMLLTGCSAQVESNAAEQPTAAVAETEQSASERTSSVGFYFDTVVTFTLFGADDTLMDDLKSACTRYENLLSKTIATSDVGRLNAAEGQPVKVDPETMTILRRAKSISDDTEHAFSVTIAPLTALWSFKEDSPRMPSDEERIAALPLVNDDALVLGEDDTVTLPAGMEIDLGGIAKGYIADVLAALCEKRSTGAMLNFGGNVYVTGSKPDGTPYRIGVRDPKSPADSIATVSVGQSTVVTSGIYERYFELDGVMYHHILDPKSGMPSQTDLASVTIIGESSMDADALCTACIVLGREKSLEMLEKLGVDALFIDREDNVTTTQGFAEKFMLSVK